MSSDSEAVARAAGAAPGAVRPPFSLAPDADFIFWTESHRQAAHTLRAGLARRAPILLLGGETGLGKTTLAQHLFGAAQPGYSIGHLSYFGGDRDDLCGWVLLAFDQAIVQGPAPRRLAALQAFIMDEYRAGRHCLLVIDEAQSATDEVLDGLRQLTNLDTGSCTPLQILLIAQPSLAARLRTPENAALRTRIGASAQLRPMTASETIAYIRHRLQTAGRSADLFTTAAMNRIHDAAKGVPRTINLLCDLCLGGLEGGDDLVGSALARDIVAAATRDGMIGAEPASGPQTEPRPVILKPEAGPTRAQQSPSAPQRPTTVANSPVPPRIVTEPRPVDPKPGAQRADTGPETAASTTDPLPRRDGDDIRQLAFNAMASLPEYIPEPGSDQELKHPSASSKRAATKKTSRAVTSDPASLDAETMADSSPLLEIAPAPGAAYVALSLRRVVGLIAASLLLFAILTAGTIALVRLAMSGLPPAPTAPAASTQPVITPAIPVRTDLVPGSARPCRAPSDHTRPADRGDGGDHGGRALLARARPRGGGPENRSRRPGTRCEPRARSRGLLSRSALRDG